MLKPGRKRYIMLGLSIKDYIIGGVAVTSLAGSTVNFISNRRLKKRLNNTEAVLQKLGAMPAPTAPTTAPQQPQAPATGEQPQAQQPQQPQQ